MSLADDPPHDELQLRECSRATRWPHCLRIGLEHALVIGSLFAGGCGFGADERTGAPISDATEWHLDGSRVVLHEDPADPLGDIGAFVEARDGDLVIGDAIKSQVKRFAPDGTLRGKFGSYGRGPNEFARIAGLAEDLEGRVVIVDPAVGRVTILTRALVPDTTILAPHLRGRIVRSGRALVALTTPPRGAAARVSAITSFAEDWQPRWSVPAPSPGTIAEYPYWSSFASNLIAASPQRIVAAYSLRYPIYLFSDSGVLLDSLAHPPSGFRAARRLEPGALGGLDGAANRDQWLESFDVIAGMHFVNDTLLVVTHGVLEFSAAGLSARHHSVDVYHALSGQRIVEARRLPQHARVLGGGHSLHILVSEPPEAWVIVRVKL